MGLAASCETWQKVNQRVLQRNARSQRTENITTCPHAGGICATVCAQVISLKLKQRSHLGSSDDHVVVVVVVAAVSPAGARVCAMKAVVGLRTTTRPNLSHSGCVVVVVVDDVSVDSLCCRRHTTAVVATGGAVAGLGRSLVVAVALC